MRICTLDMDMSMELYMDIDMDMNIDVYVGQKRGAKQNRTRMQNTILDILRRNLAKMWVLRRLGNRDLQHFVCKV